MTMQLKDLPQDQSDTPATRIRQAREAQGLSRAQLSRRTGIPAKSLEKFEYGTQEPSLSRLQSLSEALDVSTQWIMGQEEPESPADRAEADAPPDATPSPPSPAVAVPANDDDPLEAAQDMLDRLAEMRSKNFDGFRRRALALIEDLRSTLAELEPEDLIDLADARGLHRADCPSVVKLLDVFSEDPDDGQDLCGNVEERIIDTAALGADLHAIDRKALAQLAGTLEREFEELEAPGFFGDWGDHERMVPLIRPFLRKKALTGHPVDFKDLQAFPRRR